MKKIKLQEKKQRSKQIKRKGKFELLNHVLYTVYYFLDLFISDIHWKWLRDIEIVTNISESILSILSISILSISILSISILSTSISRSILSISILSISILLILLF